MSSDVLKFLQILDKTLLEGDIMETWFYGIIGAGSVIILACLLFILFQIIGLLYHKVHKPVLPFSCAKVEESSDYKESGKGRVCSFTYQEIEHFSEGFSNLVGKGSTNYIYKGILSNGTEVAVKRPKNMVMNQLDIKRRFQCQVELLSRVHHPNLINLIGYCGEKNYRMLVSQYAPNGTLYENLHGQEQLSWRQRMRIALGTAFGLSYLHHVCNPSVFHGNLSSSNILLTDDYAAKISGFGKITGRGSDLEEKSDNGMYPHIHRVESSKAGDVYAFGVLLLELVSGRQFSSQSGSELVELAKQFIQSKDRIMDIADPTLPNFVPREFYSICQISFLCTQQDAAARPSMESVIPMLVQALGIGSETAAPITNPTTLRGIVENF